MKVLCVGSRRSALSDTQTRTIITQLEHRGLVCERKSFVTSGDRFLQAPLRDIGGKGLFTKEVEEALLRGEIDCAVHSYKDMPTQLPDGLMIGAVLEREDPRDVWIANNHVPLHALPEGALIGTASLRRQVQLTKAFPHLTICETRGNILTRFEKLKRGEVDGLILALSGIKRLGCQSWITSILSFDEMFPAVSQGALVLECRVEDVETQAKIAFLDHPDTRLCTDVERAFLRALDGSCRTPIGGYAWIDKDVMHLKGFVARPDATFFAWTQERISRAAIAKNPSAFGFEVGRALNARFRAG